MTDQITPEAAEAYVRARLKHVDSTLSGEEWLTAYSLLIAREEEVRLVDEEIAKMKALVDNSRAFAKTMAFTQRHRNDCAAETPIFQRILATRQAARAELTRGWKEPKP